MICEDEPKRPDGLPDVLLVRRLETELTREQILFVLETFDNVCHHCFDRRPGCQCWNDE